MTHDAARGMPSGLCRKQTQTTTVVMCQRPPPQCVGDDSEAMRPNEDYGEERPKGLSDKQA